VKFGLRKEISINPGKSPKREREPKHTWEKTVSTTMDRCPRGKTKLPISADQFWVKKERMESKKRERAQPRLINHMENLLPYPGTGKEKKGLG